MEDKLKKVVYEKEFAVIKKHRGFFKKTYGIIKYPSGETLAKVSHRSPAMCSLIVRYYKDMEINK
jgi:hypothetical protein